MSNCPECDCINYGINPRCLSCVRRLCDLEIERLRIEIERLTTAAPDYVRVRIAKRLAGAEYIHQKLWAHSWEEAGRVMDPEKL